MDRRLSVLWSESDYLGANYLDVLYSDEAK